MSREFGLINNNNKNININDDTSDSENSDDNNSSFEYNINNQHIRNISLDTIESSAFSSDSEDNNSDSERKKGKRGSTVEAKLKEVKNKIVKTNRPVKVKSRSGQINFIGDNNNSNNNNILNKEPKKQSLTFENINPITPDKKSNNKNHNRHIVIDNKRSKDSIITFNNIPNNSSDNNTSYKNTNNTYYNNSNNNNTYNNNNSNNKTYSKASSPPSPTISYKNIKKMSESSSSTISKIFGVIFCCFCPTPLKLLFGLIKGFFSKIFKRSKTTKGNEGAKKNENENENKSDLEAQASNDGHAKNINLINENKTVEKKKNSNCCLIIFIIIMILLLLGNSIYLDVVVNNQSASMSAANNITQVINSNDTSDPIVKQLDIKIKSVVCMTLLSTVPLTEFPCDFCSRDPTQFNNVSEFCSLQVIFNNAFNRTSLEENLRWMSDPNYCDWIGVTCNSNRSIIALDIEFPHTPLTMVAGFGALTNLQNLSITGDGSIPRGTIPQNLLQSSSMVDLRLKFTGLTGPIPDTFDKMISLNRLDLVSNSNLGTELPASIGLLPSLTTLTISQQGLAGAIPDFIGQSKTLQTNLQFLSLTVNNLTGNIPNSLTQLSALKVLILNNNKLSGNIPDTLAQAKFQNTMTTLDLSSNAFQGQIPDSLSNMTSLSFLYLQSNQLNGQIPASLAKLSKLNELILNNNQLTGGIPDVIGSINISKLVLTNNTQLTGVVPASVCQRQYVTCDLTLTGLTSPAKCAVCVLPTPIAPTTTTPVTTPVPTA